MIQEGEDLEDLPEIEQKYVQQGLEVVEVLDILVAQVDLAAAVEIIMEVLVDLVDLHLEVLVVLLEMRQVRADLWVEMVPAELERQEDPKEDRSLSIMMDLEQLLMVSQ
jgi:regulator of RNase E activity RraB